MLKERLLLSRHDVLKRIYNLMMIISTARKQRQQETSANPPQIRPPMKRFQFDNGLHYYCCCCPLQLLAGMMTLSIYRLVEGF